MKLLEVLIERKAQALNRPFSYIYNGEKQVDAGYRVLVNFAHKDVVAYVIKATQTSKTKSKLESEMGFSLGEIKDVLDDKPLLNDELLKLSQEISEHYLAPLISVLQTMLPTSLKPSSASLKGPKIAYDTYVKLKNDTEDGLTPKQIEFVRMLRNSGKTLKKDCKSPSIVEKLYKKGIIEFEQVEKVRLEIPEYKKEHKKELTEDQNKAVESILNTDKTVTLLQGVTGSGKTEVYLTLSEKFLSMGRNVLMLVPEISLTPVMVEYFQRRFSGNVAILHSDLTPAEKYDEYRRISRGECHIVVGARSAIFAPLDNIGLIILDEEHVESYKQDSLPYYHAREVAIMRANHFESKVILGSATPSLETKARAIKGVYHYATLPNRINKQELPKTSIVDMSKASSFTRESSMFSKYLIEQLAAVLERKEQAILLINRRGYSGYITCRNCGHMITCPNCGIALTYHREDNMLKCHHCGHVELGVDTCPECGSKYLSKSGFGTERIVDEIKKLFPNARVLRLDSDVGEVRNNIAKTIETFANQEADILVGTQMIAKGHDFPNVTLVGVVLADIGLSLPSFRSTERAFQLITQAVGRSGRADKVGHAIIQTFNPYHYAIALASQQNYEAFFRKEMSVRKISQYPPYTFLTSLEISGKNEDAVVDIISKISRDILSQNFENVSVLGPVEPFIAYENNNYRRIILIKYKKCDKINDYLRDILESLKNKSQINVKVNVDPYDF